MKRALFLLLAVLPLAGCVRCYYFAGPIPLGEPTPPPEATPTP